jgi:phage FluMu gp28-like protein
MPSGERSREHCDCGAPIPLHLKFCPPHPEAVVLPESHEAAPSLKSEISNLKSDSPSLTTPSQDSTIPSFQIPISPWNLYFRVTITDAIQLGLLHTINRSRDSALTADQFIADCRARSGLEQIFQQAYMCNPVPGGASIVEWSAIERCRADYEIERLHLEHNQIIEKFGEFATHRQVNREEEIGELLRTSFLHLFGYVPLEERDFFSDKPKFRLGFDVAASGQGDLAAIYIDEADGDELWLRALFTCRTEDWHFIQTALFYFLKKLRHLKAAGDDTGLGKQICWEAANHFGHKFTRVNFGAKKHDLGLCLMNQLATTKKRFPKSEQDIAADYFALRKYFTGSKWAFSEGRNSTNPNSHCDIAWAGALASFVNIDEYQQVSAAVAPDDDWAPASNYPYIPLRR